MKGDIPSLINKAIDICIGYDELSGEDNHELEESLKRDMLNLMIYLSNTKVGRSVQQIVFINRLMNTCFNLITIRDYEKRNHIDSDLYLKTVPDTIVELIIRERERNGFTCSFYKDTREIYKMLKELGYYFASMDNRMDDEEVDKLNLYTNNVISYILEEESVDYLGFDSIGASVKIDWKGKQAEERIKDKVVNLLDTHKEPLNTDAFDKPEIDENNETVEEILDQINALIGLDSVKSEVNNLVNLIRVQKLRKERGMKMPSVGLHMVFVGNPGTGKTTIARQIAKIYKSLGLIKYGHMVETGRSGLVAGYMGQTAEKVQELVRDSLGGVLFIDEAYSLNNGINDDFGREAIDTLLKEMEDKRDEFAVIVAGYPDKMQDFLDSNPGLRSRFNRTIVFEDYDVNSLFKIFQKFCQDNQYILSNEAAEKAAGHFEEVYESRDEFFGNARDVRNYFERAVTNQANRIMRISEADDTQLITIEPEDLA